MIIRQEKKEEFGEIYNLINEAFKTAEVYDGTEADYTNALRESGKYIEKLALVSEENNELIGHIMLTKLKIVTSDSEIEELLLSPICVSFENRNKGVGGMLIRESFKLAKEMGYSAVFLCGNPAYYSRFGFKNTTEFGIKNTSEIPQQYVMGCELFCDALKDITGTIAVS